MSSIFDTYIREPAYFQRMVEFFLHARFKAVRIFLKEKKDECVFFAIDGTLIDTKNNKRRFATFTDWYNSVFATSHSLTKRDIFSEIYITPRVNLITILSSITQKEFDEFLDIKYRSSLAYNYIVRRMRAKFMHPCSDKKTTFTIEWDGHIYYVSHMNTRSGSSTENYLVDPFLSTICDETVPMKGLYIVLTDDTKVLLTEEDVRKHPALLETPKSPTHEIMSRLQTAEDTLRTLHTDVRILSPLQLSDRERFTREINELKTQLAEYVGHMRAMMENQQTLLTQYQNLSTIVGALLNRVHTTPSPSPPSTPLYFIPQPTYYPAQN